MQIHRNSCELCSRGTKSLHAGNAMEPTLACHAVKWHAPVYVFLHKSLVCSKFMLFATPVCVPADPKFLPKFATLEGRARHERRGGYRPMAQRLGEKCRGGSIETSGAAFGTDGVFDIKGQS
jgi:hypothetical protein